jgi:nucleotide-binding universal stress UspA family protein
MKIDKILVPVDFSTHSEAAMELADEYARQFDAELHILHVYPIGMAMVPPYGPPMPAGYGMQVERAAVLYFDEWRQKNCAADLRLTSHVRQGDPSTEIVDLASNSDVDLIIMGTRGFTGLRHVVMGSVAEHTVRRAPCPVLTTKSEVAGQDE